MCAGAQSECSSVKTSVQSPARRATAWQTVRACRNDPCNPAVLHPDHNSWHDRIDYARLHQRSVLESGRYDPSLLILLSDV